jgi:hypothetical protein
MTRLSHLIQAVDSAKPRSNDQDIDIEVVRIRSIGASALAVLPEIRLEVVVDRRDVGVAVDFAHGCLLQ